MSDILAAIEAAVGCQQCGDPLGDSPSDDFCCDRCQDAWHAAHADRLIGYREPWRRPWDFPGIGTDAHTTTSGFLPGGLVNGRMYVGQRGYRADLAIVDEVYTWVERPRPEFRLPRSTSSFANDYRAACRALDAATTAAQRAAVELRFESLHERARDTWSQVSVHITACIDGFIDAISPALAALGDHIGRVTAPATESAGQTRRLANDQPEPDARQAALDARRNRNTGPPTRGRPPRTIGRPNTTRR